jgi:hypothetical protein
VVVSLLAAVVVAVRAMRRARAAGPGKPLVEDLVGAIVVVRRRRRRRRGLGRRPTRPIGISRVPDAAGCRAARRAARPGSGTGARLVHAHGLRADPAALRALADRSRQQSAWHDARAFAAGSGGRPDRRRAARRAARARILDEGSPLEQFARYETQGGWQQRAAGASWSGRWRYAVAAEEAAAEVASRAARRWRGCARRAGAAGFDATAEPEALVAALDGWRGARPARGAVALAERPRAWPLPADVNGAERSARHAA